jgi:hypothetical protein
MELGFLPILSFDVSKCEIVIAPLDVFGTLRFFEEGASA